MQVVSKRVANAKSERYHGNILKRGKVELTKVLDNETLPVSCSGSRNRCATVIAESHVRAAKVVVGDPTSLPKTRKAHSPGPMSAT